MQFTANLLPYVGLVWIVAVHYAPLASGTILPVFVQFLNNRVKSEGLRTWIAFCSCIVLAFLLTGDTLRFSPDKIIETIGILYIESQLVFKYYFKNSRLRDWIQNIFQQRTVSITIYDDPTKKG